MELYCNLTLGFDTLRVGDRWEAWKAGRQSGWSRRWDTTLDVLKFNRESNEIRDSVQAGSLIGVGRLRKSNGGAQRFLSAPEIAPKR